MCVLQHATHTPLTSASFTQFYTGTLDTGSLSDIVNAVCRKDCVGEGEYCYSTVRSALVGGRGSARDGPYLPHQHACVFVPLSLPPPPLRPTMCVMMSLAPAPQPASRHWTRQVAADRVSLGTGTPADHALLCGHNASPCSVLLFVGPRTAWWRVPVVCWTSTPPALSSMYVVEY